MPPVLRRPGRSQVAALAQALEHWGTRGRGAGRLRVVWVRPGLVRGHGAWLCLVLLVWKQ